MEKGSRRTGQTAWDIAKLYTDAFLADLRLLHIEDSSILCRATDHIREQIEFIAQAQSHYPGFERLLLGMDSHHHRFEIELAAERGEYPHAFVGIAMPEL